MLDQIPRINGAIQGLGVIAGQNRPFVQFLVKNWFLSALAAAAMVAKIRERHKAGELGLYTGMVDLGMVLTPLVGLAMLNQLAKNEHEAAQARAAGLPPPATPPAV